MQVTAATWLSMEWSSAMLWWSIIMAAVEALGLLLVWLDGRGYGE